MVIDVLKTHPECRMDRVFIQDNKDRAVDVLAERIPTHYRDAVADHPEVVTWLHELVLSAVTTTRSFNPRLTVGPSVLMMGNVGSGKTFQAYGAVRSLLLSGIACTWRFTTAADMLGDLRPTETGNTEARFEKYLDAGLLVLDDLGAAKSSPWTEEVTYRLINHRYENEMPTFVTTNLTPRELRDGLGERVASRLREMAHQIVLTGADRRKARPRQRTA